MINNDRAPTAYTDVIRVSELVAHDDRDAALDLLARSQIEPPVLRAAALEVYSWVMSGEDATARFGETRAAVHELAQSVGAADAQVVLNLEVIGAAQALAEGDPDRADEIMRMSEFLPVDHANVSCSLLGQAVAGWCGDRALMLFAELRRQFGVAQ